MSQTEIVNIHTYERIVANETNKTIRHCRIGKITRKLPTKMGELFPDRPKGQPFPPYNYISDLWRYYAEPRKMFDLQTGRYDRGQFS